MKVNYNYIAPAYARHRQIHQPLLETLLQESSLTPGSRVLEIGCGTGNYIHAIASSISCSCYGTEPSEAMLQKAREHGDRVSFKQGSAEAIDFPDNYFDLVYSVDVIHHVINRPLYFCEAARVLKKGGKLCTVTDSEDIIRNRKPLSNYFPETVDLELERYPSISQLKHMHALAGFGPTRGMVIEQTASTEDIQIYREKGYSCLHIIPQDAFERGIQKMETDLRAGPIDTFSSYFLLWAEK